MPKDVDLNALGALFTIRYVALPDTLFSGIKEDSSGTLHDRVRNGTQIKRFWNWTPQIRADINEQELVEA